MSKSFVSVTRKQCCHCGKLFLTERHDCKFDPEKRNCLTCQHNLGQRSEHGVAFFECAKGHTDDWVEIIPIQSSNWKMDCKDWQLVELIERAHNVREAQGNKFRRILAEEAKKHQEIWDKTGGWM